MPSGIVATGWPAVEAKCAEFGDTFDEWQRGAGRVILGKREDGTYAATIGGVTLAIPRQVAKTFLVGRIVFALCVLFPGMKVLWTAHRTRTTTNTFAALQGFAKRKTVAPYIEHIRMANGEQEIKFTNGSVIMFGAREQGFGRGFDEVDIEVFDEAQILTEKALDDMVAATNQSRHEAGALLFYMGTPPRPTDPGEVFKARRKEALSGESDDAVYIECSADEDADPDDRTQWAKANPSYPHRTPLRSMLRLRKNLASDDSWKREALGIWDAATTNGALNADRWAELKDPAAERGATLSFGLDVDEDRRAWVAIAWTRPDGAVHVVLDDQSPVPAFRAAERCAELTKKWNAAVVPPKAFEDELTDAGVRIAPMGQGEFTAACGKFADKVEVGKVRHGNQVDLNEAVRLARWRSAGPNGERAFQLKGSPEIGPLAAATRAVHGLTSERPSVYETRGLVQV